MAATEPTTLEDLYSTCGSITTNALALKSKTNLLQNVDDEIEREQERGKWLERQLLEYSTGDDGRTATANGADDDKSLQEQLLKATWEQHRKSLFLERIQASLSAKAALSSNDKNTSLLAKQGLAQRDELANQVTALLSEMEKSQQELQTMTSKCRELQEENRLLHKSCSRATDDAEPADEEVLVRRRVLMDIILGAHSGKLHDNERLAKALLLLERTE